MRVFFLLSGVGFRAHPESGLTRLISPVAWSDPLGHAQEGLRPLGGPLAMTRHLSHPTFTSNLARDPWGCSHIYDDPQ